MAQTRSLMVLLVLSLTGMVFGVLSIDESSGPLTCVQTEVSQPWFDRTIRPALEQLFSAPEIHDALEVGARFHFHIEQSSLQLCRFEDQTHEPTLQLLNATAIAYRDDDKAHSGAHYDCQFMLERDLAAPKSAFSALQRSCVAHAAGAHQTYGAMCQG